MSDRFLVLVGPAARRSAEAVVRQLRVDGWIDAVMHHERNATFVLERGVGRTAQSLRFSGGSSAGGSVAPRSGAAATVGLVDPALQSERAPWEVRVTVDDATGVVTLARSPTGTRALYCTRHPVAGIELVAANSLTSVLHALPAHTFAVDRRAVASVLALGYVVEPITMLEGVAALRAGETLTFSPADASRRLTQVLPVRAEPPADTTRPRVLSEIRSALTEAVERGLRGSHAPACFLSGGVDSSLVSAIGRKLLGRPIHTFSLVFEDERLSEQRHADAVARALGTKHHNVRLTRSAFESDLDRALSTFDQPTADGLNTWFIAKAAAEHGFELALGGVGSDELFGGHDCNRTVPSALRFKRAASAVPIVVQRALAWMMASVLCAGRHHLPSRGRLGKQLTLLEVDADCAQVYFLSKCILLPRAMELAVHSRARTEVRGLAGLLQDEAARRLHADDPLLTQLSQLEQRFYLESHLLRDLAAIRTGLRIDVGVPFRHPAVVAAAHAAAHGGHLDTPRPKQVLIDAFSDVLPRAAYEREKAGFVLPIGDWLEGPLADRLAAGSAAPVLDLLGLDPVGWYRLVDDCRRARGKIYFTREWVFHVLLDWGRRHARWLRTGGSPLPVGDAPASTLHPVLTPQPHIALDQA